MTNSNQVNKEVKEEPQHAVLVSEYMCMYKGSHTNTHYLPHPHKETLVYIHHIHRKNK